MSRQPNTDRLVESWLAEGPSRLPDRVIDNIVTDIEQNPQRGPRWLPRRQQMSRTTLAVGGVAAAILLVVVGAFALGGLGNNRAGVGAQPTASPAPTIAPTLAPTTENSPMALRAAGLLEPGRHFFEDRDYRFTFTIDSPGWERQGTEEALILRDFGSDKLGAMWIWGQLPSADPLYQNPCDWQGTDIDSGSTVDEFAGALAGLDTWTSSAPADVTVGGYQGTRMQLTVPEDIDFADCDSGKFHLSPGRWYQGPGQVEDMRILDLDGTRYLVFTSYRPGASADVRAEIDRMVDSMEIEPVSQ